jgi:hypothetical protein
VLSKGLSASTTKCEYISQERIPRQRLVTASARVQSAFFFSSLVNLTLSINFHFSRANVCVHMLAAILGFQALDEAWQAFPHTIADHTKHLKNVVKSSYSSSGMNLLGLYTPMYT